MEYNNSVTGWSVSRKLHMVVEARMKSDSKVLRSMDASLYNRSETLEEKTTCSSSLNVSCSLSFSSFTSVLLRLFYLCSALVVICGNLLVIISISYFKQLHSPTNSLIVSLAVADLLVGLVVCPFSLALAELSCWYHETPLCRIRGGIDVMLCNCSVLHLCCISVDRYYAVCQPLRYGEKMSDRVTAAMILLSWSVSLVVGTGVMLVGIHKRSCVGGCSFHIQITTTFGCVVSFYLPAGVMLCIYLKILKVAQRQAHSIHSQARQSPASVSKRENKATKTLAVVMGVFLLCWTPFFLCLTFQPVSDYAIPVSVMDTFCAIGRSNSMLNPFVYAFFYSWFRAAFRAVVSGKMHRGHF